MLIMKQLIIFLVIVFHAAAVSGQASVGIGTAAPHSSAALDISSNNKGLLVPRMSNTARLSIASPANGLLVYDSTFHRLYQFQDGVWRYMLTNESWLQSSTRNWMYNSSDSIGIGTSVPTERLDVNGNIRSREGVSADNNIIASGDITATSILSTGNMIVNGDASIGSTLTTYGNIDLEAVGATLQLQSNADKKAFFQLAGNDIRMGTNSGNTSGKTILRINGEDVAAIDRFANIDLLSNRFGSRGNMVVGWKVCRFPAPSINMLPVAFGNIAATPDYTNSWVTPFFLTESFTKISTGRYEVSFYADIITPYSAIIVTPKEPNRLCIATWVSMGKFRVETYTRAGVRVDCGFSFVVSDPLN
jgi:hypothetical protein